MSMRWHPRPHLNTMNVPLEGLELFANSSNVLLEGPMRDGI